MREPLLAGLCQLRQPLQVAGSRLECLAITRDPRYLTGGRRADDSRIVVVRGHQATPWELRPWERLPDRFDVSYLESESNQFDTTSLGISAIPARTRAGRLPAPLGAIDRGRLNVNGSSLAAGHPFAATGGRIVASLAKMLHEAGPGKRGLISICAAGGQGVVAILES